MKKILLILIVFCLLISFAACSNEQNTEKPEDNTEQQPKATEPIKTEEVVETQVEPLPEGVEPVNILLMGSMDKDFSTEGETYALTHILVSLDPQNKVVKITTFPYNLAVDVQTPDELQTMQLQSVCSTYGQEAAVQTIEENFGIEIDHWVVMNMKGVISIIDALEGIEIDLKELTLNEAAEHIVDMLGLAWDEVKETGLQILSGLQTAGYFVDTMTDDADFITAEEKLFREHHENIINAVIKSIKTLELTSNDLVQIAKNVQDNYVTDIEESEWQGIADTAIYCLENEPQYLHIPQEIFKVEIDSPFGGDKWEALGYDKESDTKAVQKFVVE